MNLWFENSRPTLFVLQDIRSFFSPGAKSKSGSSDKKNQDGKANKSQSEKVQICLF